MVGYLNGTTGGFGASYIFMAGSLFLSAIITLIAVKGSNKILKDQYEEEERDNKLLLDSVALE